MSCKDVVGSHFSKFIVFGEQSDNPLHEKFCAVDGQKPEPVVLLKEISLLPRDKVGHPVKGKSSHLDKTRLGVRGFLLHRLLFLFFPVLWLSLFDR